MLTIKNKITRTIITFTCIVFITLQLRAQEDMLKKTILFDKSEYTVQSLLDFLFDEYAVNLSYGNDISSLQDIVKLNNERCTLGTILNTLSDQLQINYLYKNGTIVLYKSKNEKFSIAGTIKDKESGELLPFATILMKETNNGVVSNQYGFYSITVSQGQTVLVVSYMGYQPHEIELNVNHDVRKDIELSPSSNKLEEVVVKSGGIDRTERRLSMISMKDIKTMPSLLGEPDVFRSVKNLPGVTSAAEVGRGFNVRGGAGDQNLIILDEAVVYNASHLFGSYSVFNPDIVKNVKFYKSGIPADYGGRLSSVMDVSQREGNMRAFKINGSVGLISGRLTVEGPIVKDKLSFMVAGRKSYIDNFFRLTSEESLAHNVRASFYDINAKLNYILNDNNRLLFSLYKGDDIFKVNDYDQQYGNITSTLRFNHIYNSKLFSNSSLIYSDYKMVDGESIENWSWENEIGLKHYEFKHEFIYYVYKNTLEFGTDAIYYNFFPGEQKPAGNNSSTSKLKIPVQHALESAIYLTDKYRPTEKLEIQLGLRLSMFQYLGNEEIYSYAPGVPRNIRTITDTTKFQKNEFIETYNALEPRISINYNVNKKTSLKISYNRTTQYLHLISNTTTPTPYDMWKPSNNNIKPMFGNQFSLGCFTSFSQNMFELSVEGYYRKMQNVLEVKPGADIVLNRTLDADLLEGKGYSYGIEMLLNKVSGKNTGSISYTFSRSMRKLDQMYVNEKYLPKGFFPSNYDIPHKLTLTYSYQPGLRGQFSANFIYQSGRPVTLPDGQYVYFGTLIPYYSGKNQHRLPDYHRLDISYTYNIKEKQERKWDGYWVFSIFNVYARNNPYSRYIVRKDNSQSTEATQLSIFTTIVPSVSYTFSF